MKSRNWEYDGCPSCFYNFLKSKNVVTNTDYVTFISDIDLYCIYQDKFNNYVIMKKSKANYKNKGFPLFVGPVKQCIEWVRIKKMK